MMENNEKIDVASLLINWLRVLRKMWLQVLCLGLIFAVVMTVNANMNYRPMYTAYSSFTVNIWDGEGDNSVAAYYDNAAAEQMASSFPYILTSGVLQRMVANDMGTASVSGSIKASVVENTNLFTLSVTDTDPERAQKTLEAVIKNYPAVSEAVVGKLNMNVLDESGVPTGPDNPKNLTGDAVKGGIFGLCLGAAWAVAVTFLRRTIRSEEDCHKYINQRCLGAIPFIRIKERTDKSKDHLNIVNKNISEEFKEAIRIVRNKVERHTGEGRMKRIIVTSALAGEGKSTMAVNMALSLALEGKAVTLIDCDLRNPSDADIFNIKYEKGLIDYLNGSAAMDECQITVTNLESSKEEFHLNFIPGGKAVEDGSTYLANKKMEEIIESVSKKSEYVILDSAPVGLLTDASVLAQYADCAMFIVKKDFAKADHIMEGIEHMAESHIPVIGCVLNGE